MSCEDDVPKALERQASTVAVTKVICVDGDTFYLPFRSSLKELQSAYGEYGKNYATRMQIRRVLTSRGGEAYGLHEINALGREIRLSCDNVIEMGDPLPE
jgi:hypothetical protein